MVPKGKGYAAAVAAEIDRAVYNFHCLHDSNRHKSEQGIWRLDLLPRHPERLRRVLKPRTGKRRNLAARRFPNNYPQVWA